MTGIGPISAGLYGSAGILPISYAYIAMMGADGLTSATEHALLSRRTTLQSGSMITIRCYTRGATEGSPTNASSICVR